MKQESFKIIKKPNLDLNFEFIYGIGTKTSLIFFLKQEPKFLHKNNN